MLAFVARRPLAFRDDLSGVLQGPAPFFWNIAKSE
jgi:hypothetical protein